MTLASSATAKAPKMPSPFICDNARRAANDFRRQTHVPPEGRDAVQLVHAVGHARQPIAAGSPISGLHPGLGLQFGISASAAIAIRVALAVARRGPTMPAACQLVPDVRRLRSRSATSAPRC